MVGSGIFLLSDTLNEMNTPVKTIQEKGITQNELGITNVTDRKSVV